MTKIQTFLLGLFLTVAASAGVVYAADPGNRSTTPQLWTRQFGIVYTPTINLQTAIFGLSGSDDCFRFFDGQDGAFICYQTATGTVGMSATGSSTFAGVTMSNGTISANATDFPLTTTWLNGLASVQTLGGHKLNAAQGFNLNAVTLYTSVAASGAGNTVLRVTDGTNNCDATFSCTTDNNTTGVKRVDTTGSCTFAAGASLTLSVQTAGCATTQPTIKNIDWVGSGAIP